MARCCQGSLASPLVGYRLRLGGGLSSSASLSPWLVCAAFDAAALRYEHRTLQLGHRAVAGLVPQNTCGCEGGRGAG